MNTQFATAVANAGRSIETIAILGATVNLITAESLLHLVSESIASQHKIVIANHNLHSLYLHHTSDVKASSFRRFYDDAQYTLADGMSLIMLGRLKRLKLSHRHRVAYNDWLPFMLPFAVQNGWRVFYLGSTSDVAAKGAAILRAKFPGLQWNGHHGHFDAEYRGESNKKVLAEISSYRPHILFVGMGMPRQEHWIQENRNEIDANVILTSGATLDYIAGAKRMAPRWMGTLGFEWAYRLATEPRRLAHRYLVEPWTLLGAVLTNRLQSPQGEISPVNLDKSDTTGPHITLPDG